MSAYHPDIIFVHIGVNDLGGMSNGNIVHHLIHFVSELCRLCSSNIVIVGQLIFSPELHMNTPLINVFLSDRVHLNNIGMLRYFRRIRAIIGS